MLVVGEPALQEGNPAMGNWLQEKVRLMAAYCGWFLRLELEITVARPS